MRSINLASVNGIFKAPARSPQLEMLMYLQFIQLPAFSEADKSTGTGCKERETI